MGGTELTSYCLALAGIVLLATAIIAMLRRTLDVADAHRETTALANEGDMARLVAVCEAAPRTYLDAVRAATTAADPRTAFDAAGARLDLEWRQIADRGLTGAVLAIGAAILAWHAELQLVAIWVIGALAALCGAYFVVRRGAVAAALKLARADLLPLLGRVPEPPKLDPATGVTKAPAAMLAMLTKGKLPLATVKKPSLRDGTCPLCDHATVLTVDRRDTRFKSYVCAACGYAQDFADLAKL
jgi:hypothetical protein